MELVKICSSVCRLSITVLRDGKNRTRIWNHPHLPSKSCVKQNCKREIKKHLTLIPAFSRAWDEPEPANVSRIKSKPDRHRSFVISCVASKPNLCWCQKALKMIFCFVSVTFFRRGTPIHGWTSGCITPLNPMITETPRMCAILVPKSPLRVSTIVLWWDRHGNTKPRDYFPTNKISLFNKVFHESGALSSLW